MFGLAIAVLLLTPATSSPIVGRANVHPVRTWKAACNRIKTRVLAIRHAPANWPVSCDVISAKDSPKGFYVLALHGARYDCGDTICGSTLMGWFAVEQASGKIFEWDTGDLKLGRPLNKDS